MTTPNGGAAAGVVPRHGSAGPVADPVRVAAPGPVDLEDDLDLDGGLIDDFEAELDEPVPVVDVDQVRRFLAGLGSAVGFAIGNPKVPDHWKFDDSELDTLAPALVAIANRRPELARAIERSDHLVVAATMARYLGRNVQAGRRARRDEGDDEDGLKPEARPVGGFGMAARGNGAT